MRILVTAGPTREFLDPVRFLSNASSGLTGFLAAQAAQARGHRVVLVAGPTTCPAPEGVKLVPVVSARDMHRAVLKAFPETDAVVMTAAVSDYRPVRTSRHKLKKTGAGQMLELAPNPDILADLGRRKKHQILIGFALEDRRAESNAIDKFRRKNLDAVILNSPAALGRRTNRVRVYTRDGWQQWPAMSKQRLGEKIIRLAERLCCAL